MARRQFQIHLSTAVLMMFAAGVLIWANLREREKLVQTEMEVVTYSGGQAHWGMLNTTCYGWPATAVTMLPAASDIDIPKDYRTPEYYAHAPHWHYVNTALNLFVAGVLLALVWALSERLIARGGVRLKEKCIEQEASDQRAEIN